MLVLSSPYFFYRSFALTQVPTKHKLTISADVVSDYV